MTLCTSGFENPEGEDGIEWVFGLPAFLIVRNSRSLAVCHREFADPGSASAGYVRLSEVPS